MGAQAEVLGDPKGQMGIRVAVDVEPLRIRKHVLVAVGRRVQHGDLLAGLDPGAGQLGVLGRRPPEVMQGVGPAQDLLDRPRHE